MKKDIIQKKAVTTTPVPKDGSDWIIDGATTPIMLDESAEAEMAPDFTTWQKFCNIFKHNKLALISLIVILIIIIVSIGAPIFAPYDPNAQDFSLSLAKPSAQHLLGCDKLGRDVLSRMIYGGRISIMIGFLPTIVSMVLGTVLGITAGFVGGRTDTIIMRIADICMAFPSLLLAMVVSYTIGTGFLTIFLALSFVSWAGTARVVRSEVLALREKEYVEAATSIGVKKWTIMLRHIFPNCMPTLIVMMTNNIPGNILTESSLSFLGIGAQPPDTSWGLLVYQTKAYLQRNPAITLAPGVAILILVVAFNFLGDAVRDALDPALKDQ